MEFNRMLSELDAGLVIGVGATAIFAGLIYMMTTRQDEGEDEAMSLYKNYSRLLEKKSYKEALDEARKYLIAIMARTKNANDLGEAFTMISSAAEQAGNPGLALLSAIISCHHLNEEAIRNYPLYRECRNRSVAIEVRSNELLSEADIKEIRHKADEFLTNNNEGYREAVFCKIISEASSIY